MCYLSCYLVTSSVTTPGKVQNAMPHTPSDDWSLEALQDWHPDADPTGHAQGRPTQEGWYRTQGGADWMLYSLYQGQWYAHVLNGDTVPCEWGYIDQAGPVWLIAQYPAR